MPKKEVRKGAPSKYNEKYTAKFAGWLARDGATNEEIAKELEISTHTLNEWRKKYPELSESIRKGKEVTDYEVEDSLLKRALGYDYEKVETEVSVYGEKELKKKKVTTMHVPAEVVAIIYWLKNRKPAQWRERRVEIDFDKSKAEINQMFDAMKNST